MFRSQDDIAGINYKIDINRQTEDREMMVAVRFGLTIEDLEYAYNDGQGELEVSGDYLTLHKS